MPRSFRLLTLCFLTFFVSATAVAAQRVPAEKAIPANANLEQYPLFNEPIPLDVQTDLQLNPIRLNEEWTGLNWHPRQDRFFYEKLLPGTIVFVDKDNNPIYKADCGNRLVSWPDTSRADTASVATAPAPTVKKGLLDRIAGGLWGAMKALGGFLWDLFKMIFLGLMAFLGLALLISLLYWLWQGIRGLFDHLTDGGRGRQTAPIATIPSSTTPSGGGRPVPPVVPVPPASSGSTPTPLPTTSPSSSGSGGGIPPSTEPTPPASNRRFFAFYSSAK